MMTQAETAETIVLVLEGVIVVPRTASMAAVVRVGTAKSLAALVDLAPFGPRP